VARSPSPPSTLNWRRDGSVCAGLLLLIGLAFWPVARNEFLHYDDDDYVVENEYVNEGLTLHGVCQALTLVRAANWHPLTWISHMVDCQLFGLQPAGHHLMNLAFHAANSILLYLVLLRMTRAAWPSAAAAAVFAVHPLHVESVAWVAERKDVLSTFFGLAALWAWLSYVARPGVVRYLVVMLSYAASLMSKPMLVTLPCLLLLLDWWPLRRLRAGISLSKLLLEKLPLAIMAAASCWKAIEAQSGGHAVVPLGRLPVVDRLANIALAYCGYLEKLFVPRGLAPIYPLPKRPDYPAAIACWVLLVAVTGILLSLARRRPYLAVGWLWYLGLLVPVIGLVHVGQQSMADRYTYLPLVGIIILFAWSAADLLARWPWLRRPMVALAAVVLTACCLLTNAQTRLWASTKTLFTHTVAVTGDNPVALTNLGLAAMNEERYDDAEHALRKALQLDPTEIDAWGNLANLFRKLKKYDAALAAYAEVDRYCRDNPRCYFQMGKTLEEKGSAARAESCYQKAVTLEPTSADYRYWLAMNQQSQGKARDAVESYAKLLELRPGNPAALNNIAWICGTSADATVRNGARAVELLRPLAEKPDCDANVLDTFAAAYAEAGQFDRAVETAEKAIAKARDVAMPASAIADMEMRRDMYKEHQPFRERK